MGDVKIVFSADTNAAAAAVQQFQGAVAGHLRNLAATVAAAFSARAIKEWIAGQIEAADETGKTAQKIGMTTQALSAYQYAAQLANVEQGEFNMGLKTLAQNVADTARKGQLLAGVTVQVNGALRGMDEILPEIADRFASMPDGIAKTDLAVQLFGRAGQAMIPLLNEGAAGLARLREEAERAGVAISGETAKAAEEFNDTLTRVKAQVNGLGLSIAQELLPYLQQGADALRDFTSNAEQKTVVIRGFVDLLKGMAVAAAAAVTVFIALGQVIGQSLAFAVGNLLEMVRAVVQLFSLWWDSAKQLIEGLRTLVATVGDVGTVLGRLAARDFDGAAKAAQAAFERTKDSLAGIGLNLAENMVMAGEAVANFSNNVWRNLTTGGRGAMDSLRADWLALQSVFNTLFGPQKPEVLGPPAPGRNQGNSTFENPEAVKATQDMLAQIQAAYEAASYEKGLLLDLEYQRTLTALTNTFVASRNMRAEDLANDEQFQEAKFQLDQAFAQKRAQLAEETQRKIFDQALNNNDLKQSVVQGDPNLSEPAKLQALIPLLQEKNTLVQKAIDDATLLGLTQDLTAEKQIALQERLNALLKTQIDTQKSIAAAEAQINAARAAGARNMFSDMAATAKAFGKEGLVAYKAFASAAVVVDTAKAAMGAYSAMANIPYVGPYLAVIAAAAAVAAGAAQIANIASADAGYAVGGLVQGPGTGTSDSVRARLSNGEFVMRADAVRYYGVDLMAAINRRTALRERPVTSSAAQIASEAPGLQGGGSSAAGGVNVAPAPVHVVVVNDQNELRRFMESNAGKNVVLAHVRGNRDSLGFDT